MTFKTGMTRLLPVLTLLFIAGLRVEAQQVSGINYGGSGCPAGSADISASGDGIISILLPSYVAEAGLSNGARVSRATCGLTIPVDVPPGFRVGIFARMRGYASVGAGSANVQMEAFIAGQTGRILTKSFLSRTNGNFQVGSLTSTRLAAYSPCGTPVNLRLQTSALSKVEAMVGVEKIELQLVFQSCN